jgi:type IV secretion system protein VirD4
MSKEVILGWSLPYGAGREPLIYAGDGSLITLARPGSGKSRCVLTPNLIRWEGSMIVVDPKGELATNTALWRQQMLGQKVWVFDPFRIVDLKYMPHE